eukprot:1645186-Rhodomonas_salina.1
MDGGMESGADDCNCCDKASGKKAGRGVKGGMGGERQWDREGGRENLFDAGERNLKVAAVNLR